MQYVFLLLLGFIYVACYEKMTKGNGVFCSDNFPIQKSQDKNCCGKGDYYVLKKSPTDIEALLTVCLTLSSLLPEPLMDEYT